MAKQPIVVLFSLAIILATTLSWAQDKGETQEKTFSLIVGEDAVAEIAEEEVVEVQYEPAIEAGSWDLSLTLGYFGMTETMLDHQNLIYKATDEDFFYGSVKLVGDSAFNPILRIGYNLTSWFAIEAQVGATFAEYESEISNAMSAKPVGAANPTPVEVGEFDPEHRSSLIAITNVNAVWYPLNMKSGKGRFHPYVTGGVGSALYSIDSDYVEGSATGANVNFGGGFRLIADKLISLRVEILYQVHSIEFEPTDYFDVRDENTVKVPVYEFDEAGNFSEVTEFESQTLGGLSWQVGFTVGF